MKNSHSLIASQPPHKPRSIKFICKQLDLRYKTVYNLHAFGNPYLGFYLPEKKQQCGREIFFDPTATDEFITNVLKYRKEHMKTNQVADYLDVSMITIWRSIDTGRVLGKPLRKPVKHNSVWWWERKAVELCHSRLYG